MANILLTPSIIAKEALRLLKNNMRMGRIVHTDYTKEFKKVGDTVTIRKPNRFVVTDGAVATIQDVGESSTTIVMNQQKNVAWEFSSKDQTLIIEEYSRRYIAPAVLQLANQVDMDLCGLYVDVPNAVGVAGTPPATYLEVARARQRLTEDAVPIPNRFLAVNPDAEAVLSDGLKGVFQPTFVEKVLRDTAMGRVGSFEIFAAQNVKAHTKGIATGTPLSNGATQTGASIVTDGWTASQTGILKKGDIVTFAGVNAVNPVSRVAVSPTRLKQFVVTADVNSDGTGNATIPIYPSIVASGASQNVTASIADNSAIVVLGSHAANLAFHENAFALVMADIDMPDGASWKAREHSDNLSIRVVKDYDFTNDKDKIRLDILYGVKTIYPELACRLLG